MTVQRVPRRHVHLDFHNAGHLQGIGADFDGEAFGRRMAASHVESVNVFAKCHHGYSYYPSSFGTRHPGLERDLLGEQIDALHRVGIEAPVYISVLWDDLAARDHPEWVTHDRDGRPVARQPFSHSSPIHGERGWSTLDIASGYGSYVQEMVVELCQRYPVDGFWFDIVWAEPNYSPSGLTRASQAGINDPSDPAAMLAMARSQVLAFMADTSALVRRWAPAASIFYNGSVDAGAWQLVPHVTHLEIESLPTSGQWGYLHYPLTARYARNLGVPTVGMTGRFHRSWSDFGGLKPRAQLTYEVGTVLSGGSAVSIGDQMHPRGVLDDAVYDTLADAFETTARLEPWLVDSRPYAEIAVLSAPVDSTRGVHAIQGFSAEVYGATQVLLENHHQFDIVDPDSGQLDDYRLVIVPEGLGLTPSVIERLAGARDRGVALLLSGRSASAPTLAPFVTFEDSPMVTPSYVTVGRTSEQHPDLDPSYPYVLYGGAETMRPAIGAESWGLIRPALFERRWDHFTGHAHAPVADESRGPWVAFDGLTAVTAFPIFAAYAEHDYWVYKAMAELVTRRLLPEPALELEGPSWVEASLHQQATGNDGRGRWIVHLTSYTPRRSGTPVPRVDDTASIAGLELTLRVPARLRQGHSAPDGSTLDLTHLETGAVRATVPPLRGHAVLAFE